MGAVLAGEECVGPGGERRKEEGRGGRASTQRLVEDTRSSARGGGETYRVIDCAGRVGESWEAIGRPAPTQTHFASVRADPSDPYALAATYKARHVCGTSRVRGQRWGLAAAGR